MRLAVDGSALAGNEPVETVEEGESALVVDTYDMTANRMHASGEAALLSAAAPAAAHHGGNGGGGSASAEGAADDSTADADAAAAAARTAAERRVRSAIPPLLSAEPAVLQRPLDPYDRFVILACDGVWDVLTDQQACDSVRAALEQPHGTPDEAARKLVGDAYNAGSEDNISVLVAVLDQRLI